jgi:ABC-type phosphate transport system substrate-binding protein
MKTLMLVLALTAVSISAWSKEVALVIAKSSSLQGVQSAEITKAFKTLPAKWADGKEIVFVVKVPASSETKVFGARLLNQSADQLPAFFANAKKTFVIVATDEEVIKTVNSMPNAIGIVDLYSINGSVTVLKIDGKLPLEPGYLLHYN